MASPGVVSEHVGLDAIEGHFAKRYAPVKISGTVRPSELDYRIECLGQPEAGFSRFDSQSGFTLATQTELDLLLIQMPVQNGVINRSGAQHMRAGPGAIAVVNTRHVSEICYEPGMMMVALTLGMNRLTKVLSSLVGGPVLAPLDFRSVVSASDGAGQLLSSLVHSVRLAHAAGLPPSSLALQSLEDSLVLLLLERLPHSHADRLKADTHQVTPAIIRRAVEFMQANAARPIRLLDIAEHAGISIRSLQTNFMRSKGMSPSAYLRQLRLQGARDALRDDAAGSIAEVAFRWGFAGPGRFSGAFREAFGETPREFVRRCRI